MSYVGEYNSLQMYSVHITINSIKYIITSKSEL